MENLAYALTQVVHNFGAVVVVGAAACALVPARRTAGAGRALAWLVLGAWAAQAASGAGFGIVSWTLYGKTPDLHAVAQAALAIKVACVVAGLSIAGWLVVRKRWAAGAPWAVLTGLGATALTAAAFLRWFA